MVTRSLSAALTMPEPCDDLARGARTRARPRTVRRAAQPSEAERAFVAIAARARCGPPERALVPPERALCTWQKRV
eukprot:6710062-Prymnesium_polylepis.1